MIIPPLFLLKWINGTLDHLLVQAVVIYWMMLGGMPLFHPVLELGLKRAMHSLELSG